MKILKKNFFGELNYKDVYSDKKKTLEILKNLNKNMFIIHVCNIKLNILVKNLNTIKLIGN